EEAPSHAWCCEGQAAGKESAMPRSQAIPLPGAIGPILSRFAIALTAPTFQRAVALFVGGTRRSQDPRPPSASCCWTASAARRDGSRRARVEHIPRCGSVTHVPGLICYLCTRSGQDLVGQTFLSVVPGHSCPGTTSRS